MNHSSSRAQVAVAMFEGFALEVVLTTANSAAQAWYGYDQGIIAGILVSDQFLHTFPMINKAVIEGTFTSIFSVCLPASSLTDRSSNDCQLGNLIGCLLAALFGDKLGRKNTLRVGAAISAVGAILQFSATSFAHHRDELPGLHRDDAADGRGAFLIIAIDGPAASGKGTLGKRLAAHYGLRHLDTGLIYRAVAKALLDAGHPLDDRVRAVAAAQGARPGAFRRAGAERPCRRRGAPRSSRRSRRCARRC